MERAKRLRPRGYWHASRRTLIIFLVSFDKLAPGIRYPRFSCPPWFAWLHLTAPPLLLKSQISSSKRASFYFFSTFSSDSVCPNTRTSVYIRRYTDAEFGEYRKREPRKGESLPVWKNSKRKERRFASRRIRGGFREELSSAQRDERDGLPVRRESYSLGAGRRESQKLRLQASWNTPRRRSFTTHCGDPGK